MLIFKFSESKVIYHTNFYNSKVIQIFKIFTFVQIPQELLIAYLNCYSETWFSQNSQTYYNDLLGNKQDVMVFRLMILFTHSSYSCSSLTYLYEVDTTCTFLPYLSISRHLSTQSFHPSFLIIPLLYPFIYYLYLTQFVYGNRTYDMLTPS